MRAESRILKTEKKDKISEQILHYLFTVTPESVFTSDIAKELARDEEFIKDILLGLKNKNLVVEINKNNKGTTYLKRQRWRLTNSVYEVYKKVCYKTGTRPLTQRRVSDIVAELDMLGIINAKVTSKGRYGRTREIELAINDSILNKTKKILEKDLDLNTEG